MDHGQAKQRFRFLSEAFHGEGGFAPQVVWETQALTTTTADGTPMQALRRVPKLAAPCHIVPHPRESPERYAARAAVAVYENHLREACERFIGYLGRRRPTRDGINAPLVELLLQDADMRGNGLDVFWQMFALHAKARGSLLLLIDLPAQPEGAEPVSLQDQLVRRAVPFLRVINPEDVTAIDVDDATGRIEWVEISCCEEVDGKEQVCTRRWDDTTWSVRVGERLISQGDHGFGQCPVLAFTESGDLFPHVGKYAQIADMSRGVFNNRSRLDELLSGQTFSILTLHVPAESASAYNAASAVANIGVSSILTHPGDTPAFISPDQGNAETYLKVIDQLQAGIKRVAMDEATSEGGAAESGVARKLRFERLNADLASFAHRLQQLEQRMWALFHRALGTENRVTVEWPSDFNLVDTQAELDILLSMQTTGFPPAVLAAKRGTVVGAEFDGADEDTKAALLAAIDEQAQEPAPQDPNPNDPTGA